MAKAADFRIIFKSEQIVNSPMAYLTTLPADLKAAIKKAVLEVATKDPAAFDKIYEGKQKPFQAIDHKAYEPIVELIKFVDELRKKKSVVLSQRSRGGAGRSRRLRRFAIRPSMAGAVLRLPPEQLEHAHGGLSRGGRGEARCALRSGLRILVVAIGLAGIAGEVDLAQVLRQHPPAAELHLEHRPDALLGEPLAPISPSGSGISRTGSSSWSTRC